jgi:hypothetical protein
MVNNTKFELLANQKIRYNPSDMNSKYFRLYHSKGDIHATPDIKDKIIAKNL